MSRTHRTIAAELPPLDDPSSASQLVRRANWDLIHGLRLWEVWARLSTNEVRRRYKRTVLGPNWVTVSLLVFATIMSVVWASLWKLSVVEFLPFLLSGLIPWTMLSTSISESTTVFSTGEPLMKSRQFPYSILIYGAVSRNVIVLLHNLVGYVIVAVLCGVSLGWATLLLAPGLVLFIANTGWICMLVAIFCLRFRDFQQIVTSLLQVAMFVTPVFWAAHQLPGRRALIADANPLYHMIELVRQPLLGNAPSLASWLVCAASAILGWALTYWFFARKRHRLAYWF